MISFYPGPSRVHSKAPQYFKEAYQSGILSINHRSDEFAKLYKDTVAQIRQKLKVPTSYRVLFTSSATENWEILAQSLTEKASVHIYSGAFGEKWFNYAKHIHRGCKNFIFQPNEVLDLKSFKLPASPEMICLTHNETSNGTALSKRILKELRVKYSSSLICVDATSSLGGIKLDFKLADAWYASVQKCLGLPAGMGLLICSPKLVGAASKIGESGRYNSFNFMAMNSEKWQTPFTPNVSNIYMLKRVLEDSDPIDKVEKKIFERYEGWVKVFKKTKKFSLFIENDLARSKTVIAVQGKKQDITKLKKDARKNNFLLGSGYGELKSTTFRIANFPALKDREVSGLQKFFLNNYS